MMDLFAYSTPGQNLVVSGTGVSDTKMREDAAGNGKYYARVYADGAPPTDLKVTNTTDAPDSVDHVALSQFGDKVHVDSAVYNNDNQTLTVTAESGDPAASLSVDGLTGGAPSIGATGATTWTFANLPVPPDNVTVSSDKGGVGIGDVVITGADNPAADVVATLTASANAVQVGQTVSLDGTSSSGTITGSSFSMTPSSGATLTGTGLSRTFNASAAGTYTVTLTVTGAGTANTSTDKATIVVSDANAAPVADAGPDQLGVVPTSVVTLDGSASKFASTYAWTQTAGPALTGANALQRANTANPTFVVPASSTAQTFTFKLTITDVNTTSAFDSVSVTSDPGAVTVDSATYKRGSLEWRVRGSAKYCSANNVVSIYWNKPATATTAATSVLVGTTSPTLALGVCSYDFRLKNAPAALQPTTAGTVTARSTYGGEALNQPFQLL
jgi:PKD repeat protein